jgi:hypothetical protein
MVCSRCESDHGAQFPAEIAIHFPGIENLDKPAVWVFDELATCLDCGTVVFTIPEEQLASLRDIADGKAGHD